MTVDGFFLGWAIFLVVCSVFVIRSAWKRGQGL